MANKVTTYVRLKDRKSSQGCMVAKISFNNSTVVVFDGKVPPAITQAVKMGILEECKKADYQKYLDLQKEAEANGIKVREERRKAYIKRVAAKSGETEEKVEKKTPKAKAEAKEEKKETKKTTKKNEKKDDKDSGEGGDGDSGDK